MGELIMTLADFGDLIPVLALAYGVVLGVVALVEGWHLLKDRRPRRTRGVAVPPAGVTAPDGDADEHRRAHGGATGWSTPVPRRRTW